SLTMPVVFKDVMREIITNSRKYTNPGGNIDIKLEMSDHLLRFEVSDSGYGIPESELENVVDYKFRASNVIQNKMILGNGFGLTKAYYNTKQLGGRMHIESVLDKGTTVIIEIPIPDKEFVSANFGAMD